MPDPAECMVEINGAMFWTKRHGSGQPVVLLHGGPGLWDTFDQLAALLDDVVEVHRYDQRGAGRSAVAPPYTVEQFVADLEALRVWWGHERWVVAGHSAGANLALAYALAHPGRVAALVCLSGTGVVSDWSEEYHANADARRTPEQRERLAELGRLRRTEGGQWTPDLDREFCLLTWLPDFAESSAAPRLIAPLLRSFAPNYAVNAAMNADWKRLFADGAFVERVAGITVPALVVHGAEDPRPLRLAERLASMLPNAQLVTVPRAAHWPWLEQPEAVRKALGGFLSEAGWLRHAASR